MSRKIKPVVVFSILLIFTLSINMGNAGPFENPYFVMSGEKVNLEISPDRILVISDNGIINPILEQELKIFGLKQTCMKIKRSETDLNIYELDCTLPDDVLESFQTIKDIIYADYVYTLKGQDIIIDDTFVIKFKDELEPLETEELIKNRKLEIAKKFDFAKNCYQLKVTNWKDKNTIDTCNDLYESEDVEFAYPDFYSKLEMHHNPDDPYYNNQWHLNNTGQDNGIEGMDIDADQAWDITKGDPDLIIAVIDNGIDVNHEDLQDDKILDGIILVEDYYVGETPDIMGDHGTSVSGVIAANIDNNVGLSGVAPNCRILPIKLLGGLTKVSSHAEAFVLAATRGASILNNSWGISSDFDELVPLPDLDRIGLDYAADVGRDGLGCLIFFAAGNSYEELSSNQLVTYKKCLTIGAVTDQGIKAEYSDYGKYLDLCAPSGGGKTSGIWTTDASSEKGYNMGRIIPGFYGAGVGLYGEDIEEVEYTAAFSKDGINWGEKIEEQEPNENPYSDQGNFVPFPGQITGKCRVGDANFMGIHDLFYLQVTQKSEFYFKLTYSPPEAVMVAGMAGFSGQELIYIFGDAAIGGLMEKKMPLGDPEGNYTNSFSGTSSACPVASGVAALILSKYPKLTRHEVQWIMEDTATKIDPAGGNYDQTDKSDLYGWGMVNAKAALDKAAEVFQLESYYIWSNIDEIMESGAYTLKILFGFPNGKQYWDRENLTYHIMEFDILLNSQSVYKGNEKAFDKFFDVGTYSAIFEMPLPQLQTGANFELGFIMKDKNLQNGSFIDYKKSIKIKID